MPGHIALAPVTPMAMTFALWSPAFEDAGRLPVRYTCDGDDLSPPLVWAHPPDSTVGFALVMDDPDAASGLFTHWLLADIPADHRGLESAARSAFPGVSGLNDFGRVGFGGPCPPRRDAPHRYRFFLHALRGFMGMRPGATRDEFDRLLRDKVVATATLTTVYGRP